jgi:murein DD-endopeptidase MepM/ murein hydrolase activator NlpD
MSERPATFRRLRGCAFRRFLGRACAVVGSVLVLGGCASLSGGGTSVERILHSTRALDRELSGSRAPSGEKVRFTRLPLSTLRMTSPYRGKHRRNHAGVDLDGDRGDPILAVESGIVVHAGEGIRGYGLTVIVRHGRGYSTLYAHADKLDVRVGDRVVAGQRLGAVGSTGNASGPHLHFEVRRDTAAVDPMPFLPRAP